MERKINVAILGCGLMGCTMIENIWDSPYLGEIIGYDIKQEALDNVRSKFNIRVTNNLDEILQDESIRLVYIAASNNAHVPLAIAAMRAGKAVMTEKPVGLSKPEMDSLIAVQKETGAYIQVGLELRYSKLYLKAKEVIDSGRIGTPVSYHYTYSCSPYEVGNWRLDPQNSGSMYHEKLCHYIDLVRWWNGSRVNQYVVTSAPNTLPHFGIEDNVHVSYRFENGAVSHLFFLMTAAPSGNSDMLRMKTDLFDQDKDGHKLNYIITGTKGAIEIDVFQRQLRVYRHAGDPEQTRTAEEVTEIYAWDEGADQEHFHNTQAQNLDILRRVAMGEEPYLLLEDAAETMRLCLEFSQAQHEHPWEVISR